MKLFASSALCAVAFAALSAPSQAWACAAGSRVVFSCTTKKNKRIEVCDAGRTIQYAFGRKGAKPELALSVPRKAASTFQWNGIGRYMTYTVDIPNGNTVYSVFWSAERDPEGEITAGVNVEIGGNHAATVECSADSIVQNIEGIDLRSSDL